MNRFNAAILTLLTLILLTACNAPAACPTPISELPAQDTMHVIVDVDMNLDDITALLYLMQHPAVTIEAITVSGTGEGHCEPGVRHVLSLLDLHGSPETPVACGRETPIEGTHEFPAAWRQAADSLYGVTLPASQRQPDPDPAPALIARILRESDAPITVLTLGPLTNTAEAFQQSPGSVANVERLVIMGGAVDAEGNVGSSGVGINNSVAEWNIYVDPTAAQMVLESGVPITLVPLDATNDVPATRAFYDCVEQSASTPEADFVHQLQQANREFIESGGYFFWDPATAATMTDGSLATFEERTITVDITEGPTSGQTRTDPSGTVIQMATGIDKEKFEALLLSVLNWP